MLERILAVLDKVLDVLWPAFILLFRGFLHILLVFADVFEVSPRQILVWSYILLLLLFLLLFFFVLRNHSWLWSSLGDGSRFCFLCLLRGALWLIVIFWWALVADADAREADEARLTQGWFVLVRHKFRGLHAQNVSLIHLWRWVLRLELGVSPPVGVLLDLGFLWPLLFDRAYRYRDGWICGHIVVLLLLLLLLLEENVWLWLED